MAEEPDGTPAKCKVLGLIFESNEINIEFPDGNCEWYNLSDYELLTEQLTIEELRDQFEVKFRAVYLWKDIDFKLDFFSNNNYLDNQVNSAWQFYYECARVNKILKDGE